MDYQHAFQVSIHVSIFNSVSHNLEFDRDGLENIVGKGENAGNQHFRLFSQSFLYSQRLKKIQVKQYFFWRLKMFSI